MGSPNAKKILVVEDEFIIAMELQMMLQRCGYEVIGPVSTVADGLAAVDRENPDVAVLDVSLSGDSAIAVAERLRQKKIPFVFSSGYELQDLPVEMRNVPLLKKPFSFQLLHQQLNRVLNLETN
jgi:CheY-like chemotaxis protein